LLVHAADGKQVYRADRPVDRGLDDVRMREIGENGVSRAVEVKCCIRVATGIPLPSLVAYAGVGRGFVGSR
jgi:hypothetical protein